MAVYQQGPFIDRIAGADFSSSRYLIVKQQVDATNPTGRSLILATSATDALYGVLNNTVSAGDVAEVVARNAQGTFKVVAGGTVAMGDKLTCNASSQAITTTTAGNQIIGIAEQAGVAGQVIEYSPRTTTV